MIIRNSRVFSKVLVGRKSFYICKKRTSDENGNYENMPLLILL